MATHPPEEQAGLWVPLGGRGEIPVVLAPANGFPPHIYRPLVQHLLRLFPQARVWGWVPRPMRAEGPPPARLRWQDLAGEYAQALAAWSGPVLGLGHSLGGVMTLMAWVLQPDLFQGIVLMDPVIFEPRVLRYIRRWQRQGAPLQSDFPLARLVAGALHRRRRFPSPQAALEHFRSRSFFRSWSEAALQEYVTHGLRPVGEAWELAYPPEWEAAVFAAVPTDVWSWVRRIPGPGWVFFGEFSEMGTPPTRCLLPRRWPHGRVEVLVGRGHMFPVEDPEAAAHAVARALQSLSPKAP